MAKHEELIAAFDRPIWTAPEGGYIIGKTIDGDTVCGPADEGDLLKGLPYRFVGFWKSNPRYGRQFQFVCVVREMPHTRDAVVKYLTRQLAGEATGLGHMAAHKLFDVYGSDAVSKLTRDPAAVAEECGFKIEKCRAASVVLERDAAMQNTKIDLIDIFSGKGFSKHTIKAVVEKWGARAPAMIRRDAFLLLTFGIPGAGFLRCDRLYLELGGSPARLKRQTLAGWHWVNTEADGDTWVQAHRVGEAIAAKIASVDANPVKAIKLGRRARWLAVRRDEGGPWVADDNRAESEADVARIAARMAAEPGCWPAVTSAALSDHQRERLTLATRGRLGILAGTPGTGKTFTAAAIIEAIVAADGVGAVAVAAPTGKAGARITETLQTYGLPLRGMTMHRLLRPLDSAGRIGREWKFIHNEANPLPYRWYLLDEQSMTDTDLMASFLRAVPAGGHVLLIGDPYQLPPVGHGAPLRDLIDAGVPCGELAEIRRNAGLIVEACAAIKSGERFRVADSFTDVDNLKIIPVSSAAAIMDELRQLYEVVIAAGNRDPFEDVQVLVPLNKQSDAGREKLNKFLQGLLNPEGVTAAECKYRVDDKIVCLTNGKYPGRNSGTWAIYNGECGRCVAVEGSPSNQSIIFTFPDTGEGMREVRFPASMKDYTEAFDLAYALTVHKSQGSEWPVVVIVADDAADRIASREWWYTAISRARKRCVVLGSRMTLERQCRKVGLKKRKTFLRELLVELLPKPDLGPQADDAIEQELEAEAFGALA